jgi:hypothetical protein
MPPNFSMGLCGSGPRDIYIIQTKQAARPWPIQLPFLPGFLAYILSLSLSLSLSLCLYVNSDLVLENEWSRL